MKPNATGQFLVLFSFLPQTIFGYQNSPCILKYRKKKKILNHVISLGRKSPQDWQPCPKKKQQTSSHGL